MATNLGLYVFLETLTWPLPQGLDPWAWVAELSFDATDMPKELNVRLEVQAQTKTGLSDVLERSLIIKPWGLEYADHAGVFCGTYDMKWHACAGNKRRYDRRCVTVCTPGADAAGVTLCARAC